MKEVVRYELGLLVMEADLYHMTFALRTIKDDCKEFGYVFHKKWMPEFAKMCITKDGSTIIYSDNGEVFIFLHAEIKGQVVTVVGLPCGTVIVERKYEDVMNIMRDCCRMLDMDFSQV